MKRGRPKGYSPYTNITYEELGDWVGRKTKIVVCKKWLESLIDEPTESSHTPVITEPAEEAEQPKIEYKLTHF